MKYYIQDKRQYVGNDMLFWTQSKGGYTTDLDKAGLFTEAEAREICRHRKSDIAWPENHLKEVCKKVVDMQYVNLVKRKFLRGIE